MKRAEFFRTTFIFSIFVLISTMLYAYDLSSIEQFKKDHNIDRAEPLFIDDEIILTTDDGQELSLRKLNPLYDSNNIREKLINNGYHRPPNGDRLYFLLCEHKILLYFDGDIDFLDKNKDSIKLERLEKIKNFTLYSFNYLRSCDDENECFHNHNYIYNDGSFTKDNTVSKLVWIDDNDICCGSFMHLPVDHILGYLTIFSIPDIDTFVAPPDTEIARYIKEAPAITEHVKAYYTNNKDVLIYILKEKLTRPYVYSDPLSRSLSDEPFIMYLLIELIKSIDADEYVEIHQILSELEALGREEICKHRVQNLSYSVDELIEIFNGWVEKGWADRTVDRPEIKGSLPATQEELTTFVAWLKTIHHGLGIVNDDFSDDFGTEIKFELVKEGVKITSAGRDKEFGTDDDIAFVRTYESVGMKPLD